MAPATEAAWLDILAKHARPTNFENVADAVDEFKTATNAEPYSLRIWLAYCEFLSSLTEYSQSWEEDERLVCEEVFSDTIIQETWATALERTKYRINDSHILWNSWITKEIDKGTTTPQVVCRFFTDRLQIPSSAWDDTSQRYSSYLSENMQDKYEEAMIEVTQLAKVAKSQYDVRERWELQLNALSDSEARKVHYGDYLQFEFTQSRKERRGNLLLVALYERALLEFPSESAIWEEYVITLGEDKTGQLYTLERAVQHCPTSQSLWSRYILSAEIYGQDPSEVEAIMERAVQPQNLLSLSEAILTYSTWCNYLTRSLAADVVPSGIMTAIDNVNKFQQLDPTFSLERILIGFHTGQGDIDGARTIFERLSKTHGGSYDFWQQFAEWETLVGLDDPRRANVKKVYEKALKHPELDWPEKVLELYNRHCNLYADALGLMAAKDFMFRSQKLLNKRRQREAAAYAAQQVVVEDTASQSKRKRESSVEEENKKIKSDHDMDVGQVVASPVPSVADSEPHRDREHLSLLVTNLPPDVTATAVKKFFKGYGGIQQPIQLIKGRADMNETSIALVEFRSPEDVATARLRDTKLFEDTGIAISVKPAINLTLYVTNFPDSQFGQDDFIYKMFGKYGQLFPPRWPNKEKRLMANLTRRFVYLSYTTPEAAAAAQELDAKEIIPEDNIYSRFTMIVKYSNPNMRKAREPKKPRDQPKPRRFPKPSTELEDTDMGGVENGSGEAKITNESTIVEAEKEKPKPASFMPQGPIRRPVMGGPKKRVGFSRT